LTVTSLYIYISVKHFRIANIKKKSIPVSQLSQEEIVTQTLSIAIEAIRNTTTLKENYMDFPYKTVRVLYILDSDVSGRHNDKII
jgi:hypothetical protein